MLLIDLTAFVILVAVCAYGVLAGADFGGGVWDLFARGPRKMEQRAAIARAMAPVWEANHVWLIFVIVLLFTALPGAFALLVTALFIPFHLALIGIVLRGAAFVFRAHAPRARDGAVGPGAGAAGAAEVTRFARHTGVVFGVASTVTPLLLGMALGSVSAGRIEGELPGIDSGMGALAISLAWLSPIALFTGLLALALCAYVAAVFLAWECQARGERGLTEDFRDRALYTGGVVVALSVCVIPLLAHEAPSLARSLFTWRALPVVLTGGVAALVAGFALLRRHMHLARIATVVQIAALLGGWGLAQYPYVLYPSLTLAQAAAPDTTLRFLLVSMPFAALLLGPSLWLLFRVFKQRGRLRA
jgi:cytochrome d ubiquinol oxidase subunit II